MYTYFLVEKADQIATITLNRPEKRNPINVDMLKEFEVILHDIRDDAATRVVILTGSGNSFCAGADLSIVKGVTDEAEKQRIFAEARNHRIRLIARTFTMLENLEKAAQRYEAWQERRAPGNIAVMREWMQQEKQKKASAAKA